jgi:NAD(P)-dependent dehydrogenase (short-subunit alcohol dehydrogenase family)
MNAAGQKIDQPVVLVTGGSRGLGLSIVKRFQEAGYCVASWATNLEGAKRGKPQWAAGCDVRDPQQVHGAMDTLLAATGRLDVVINNAGIAGENSWEPDGDDAKWHAIIDTNLHGPYYVTKAALPHLPDKDGRIIMIASVLGLQAVADQSAYCAAKHGLVGMTRSLALHLAKRQIPVNAICPGWIRTDMASQRAKEMSSSVSDLASGVPLGRMVEPDEVSALCLYLASKKGAMVTGQTLTIDGGSSL